MSVNGGTSYYVNLEKGAVRNKKAQWVGVASPVGIIVQLKHSRASIAMRGMCDFLCGAVSPSS